MPSDSQGTPLDVMYDIDDIYSKMNRSANDFEFDIYFFIFSYTFVLSEIYYG